MPKTYEPIATTTGTGSSTSITFSSIPSTYTDLVLVCSVIVPSSSSIAIQFNSDTGNNYSYTVLDSDGATASSNRQTNVNVINLAGWSSNLGSTTSPSPIICHINNYSNNTTFKTGLVRSTAYGTSSSCVDAFVGTWRNTATITSVRVFSSSANLATSSTFTLYGIKAA
jgi:hypothetical protein